jgi:hypothetical protein
VRPGPGGACHGDLLLLAVTVIYEGTFSRDSLPQGGYQESTGFLLIGCRFAIRFFAGAAPPGPPPGYRCLGMLV